MTYLSILMQGRSFDDRLTLSQIGSESFHDKIMCLGGLSFPLHDISNKKTTLNNLKTSVQKSSKFQLFSGLPRPKTDLQ